MTRISPAHPLDEQELLGSSQRQRLDQQSAAILEHRPELGEAIGALARTLSGDSATLPLRLVELLRLRIAFWNQCRSCMSVRYLPESEMSEDLVCSLERPEEADDLSSAEKVALRFADLMACDHLAIDEGTYDELHEHFTEAQILELAVNCAYCVGFGRMAATFAMHDHLHERFRTDQEAPYTPWGPGALR